MLRRPFADRRSDEWEVRDKPRGTSYAIVVVYGTSVKRILPLNVGLQFLGLVPTLALWRPKPDHLPLHFKCPKNQERA